MNRTSAGSASARRRTFTVDAYPDDRFTGTVSQIRLAPVSIQNVVNYTVIIDFDNDQLKLMPGMTANVRILVGSSRMFCGFRTWRCDSSRRPIWWTAPKSRRCARRASGMGGGEAVRGMGPGEMAMGRGGDTTGSAERRVRRQAMRDSIQAAHGGKMSDEELMGEMRKVFEKMRPGRRATATGAATGKASLASVPSSAFRDSKHISRVPEGCVKPVQQVARGRVWIMNSSGKLEPVFVGTGLTDGRYTEVRSQSLKQGDQIVLGATSTAEAAAGPQRTRWRRNHRWEGAGVDQTARYRLRRVRTVR